MKHGEIVKIERSWNKKPLHGIPSGCLSPPVCEGKVSCDIVSETWVELNRHVQENRDVEVGGVLLGEVYHEGRMYHVRVTEVLPAKHTECGAFYLTPIFSEHLVVISSP